MSSAESSSLNITLDPDRDNYAVMGNPVAHSKSPVIHNAFAKQTDQSISYQAIHVPEDMFNAAVQEFKALGGKGLNITLPFKQDAYRLSDKLSSRASSAMAVNTLAFTDENIITGDNTDGVGLIRDMLNNNISIQGNRVLIIGAGGAVRGIMGPLLEQKPELILIANRTVGKAYDLVNSFEQSNISACGLDDLNGKDSFDLIINGTSSGLKGEMPSLPATIISSGTCCYDMVYGEHETVFNQWCQSKGAKQTLDGLGMLVEQAAESFLIWRGVWPETASVIESLRKQVRG